MEFDEEHLMREESRLRWFKRRDQHTAHQEAWYLGENVLKDSSVQLVDGLPPIFRSLRMENHLRSNT